MPLIRKCGTPRCFQACAPGANKCGEHLARDAEREVIRTERRAISEPWRRLYRTEEWTACKRAVKKRDGYKCVECGQHWISTEPGGGLQVHHQAPIATLWYRADGDWETFLALGTNPAICVTLCPSCHDAADKKLRAEQQGYRDEARRYAPPSPRRRRRR